MTDSTQTMIHSAIDFTSDTRVVYRVYDIANGNFITTFRQTTSESLSLTSVYVDSDSIAWISMNSTSGQSEFIRFNQSSGSSITYRQTGYNYRWQYADNQNKWFAVTNDNSIHYGYLSSMNDLQGLNVTESNTGFIENQTVINKLSTIVSYASSYDTVSLASDANYSTSDDLYTGTNDQCIDDTTDSSFKGATFSILLAVLSFMIISFIIVKRVTEFVKTRYNKHKSIKKLITKSEAIEESEDI